MKNKIFISLLLVSFFNYIGCYSYYTLTENEINEGRPDPDESIKLILKDESQFNCSPLFDQQTYDVYYLKVDKPGRFLIGRGDKINKDTKVRSAFEGIVLGEMIDSSRIFIIDTEEYSVYWIKDNTRLSFKKGEFIDILPEQGTGYYLWKPNGIERKISFDEIKEIQESSINWYVIGPLTAIFIAASIGLILLVAQAPHN
jgi:hypothetical protein